MILFIYLISFGIFWNFSLYLTFSEDLGLKFHLQLSIYTHAVAIKFREIANRCDLVIPNIAHATAAVKLILAVSAGTQHFLW